MLITEVLSNPRLIQGFSEKEWDLLVRQARRSGLLSRLYCQFSSEGWVEKIPVNIKRHFISSDRIYEKLHQSVEFELLELKKLLEQAGVDLIALKGAGYIVSNLSAGKGRLFSDIDILVPENSLNAVERVLANNCWYSPYSDKYDQRYYRKWMHELPPMKHVERKTVLDIHHTILPLTGRIKIEGAELIARSVESEMPGIKVLCREEMLLHSIAHLFHDGELDHGLRDLSDIDLLLREFCETENFWQELVDRANRLNLMRPLFYAIRYARMILKTPVPDSVVVSLASASPAPVLLKVMDFLFLRALAPDHASCDDRWTGLARWALFVRSHWLKMPPLKLAQHLARKGYKRWIGRENLA